MYAGFSDSVFVWRWYDAVCGICRCWALCTSAVCFPLADHFNGGPGNPSQCFTASLLRFYRGRDGTLRVLRSEEAVVVGGVGGGG